MSNVPERSSRAWTTIGSSFPPTSDHRWSFAREHVADLRSRQRRDGVGGIDDDHDPVEGDDVLAGRRGQVAERRGLLGLVGTDATGRHRHVARPGREILEPGRRSVGEDLDRLDRPVAVDRLDADFVRGRSSSNDGLRCGAPLKEGLGERRSELAPDRVGPVQPDRERRGRRHERRGRDRSGGRGPPGAPPRATRSRRRARRRGSRANRRERDVAVGPATRSSSRRWGQGG